MIHEIKQPNGTSNFVISSCNVWRPGAFTCRKAAWHGQRLSDEQLQDLQRRQPIGQAITLEQVKAEREKAKP